MAQKGRTDIVLNVGANTEQAKKDIRQTLVELSKGAEINVKIANNGKQEVVKFKNIIEGGLNNVTADVDFNNISKSLNVEMDIVKKLVRETVNYIQTELNKAYSFDTLNEKKVKGKTDTGNNKSGTPTSSASTTPVAEVDLSAQQKQLDDLKTQAKELNDLYKQQDKIVRDLNNQIKKASDTKNIANIDSDLVDKLITTTDKISAKWDKGDAAPKLEKNFTKMFRDYLANGSDYFKLDEDMREIYDAIEGYKDNGEPLKGSKTKIERLTEQWKKEGYGTTSKKEEDNSEQIAELGKQLDAARQEKKSTKQQIDALQKKINTLNGEIIKAKNESVKAQSETKAKTDVKPSAIKEEIKTKPSVSGDNDKPKNDDVEVIEAKVKIINEDTALDGIKNKEVPITINPKLAEDFVLNIPNAKVSKLDVAENADVNIPKAKISDQVINSSANDKKPKSTNIWEGIDVDTQKLIKIISNQNTTNKQKSGLELFKEIGSMIKTSIDNNSPLNKEEVAKLISLVKSYKKVTGKDSPIGDMLKAAGATKDMDIMPGYSDLKKQYDEVLKRQTKAKQSQEKVIVEEPKDKPKEIVVNTKLNVTNDEISSLKSKIETGLGQIDVKLNSDNNAASPEKQVDKYEQIKTQLKEIAELQKIVNSGNKNLAPTYSSTGSKLTTPGISEEDIRGKSVTKKSIENLVKQYNEAFRKAQTQQAIDSKAENPYIKQANALKEQIKIYAGSYKDINSLMSIKTEGDFSWAGVAGEIDRATKSQQAYLQVSEKTKALFAELSKVTGKKFTNDDVNSFRDAMASGKGGTKINELTGGELGSKQNNTETSSLEKLKAELKQVDTIVEATKNSIKGIVLGVDTEVEKAQSSITTLLSSIGNIGVSFDKATTDVTAGSTQQIENISKIQQAVTALAEGLRNAGIENVKELKTISKELDNTQAEKKNLSVPQRIGMKDSLIKASSKTDNFEIDSNSIKISQEGIVSFSAIIEDFGNKVTVAKYKFDDFERAINSTGKLNSRYLNKNAIDVSTKDVKFDSKNLEEQFLKAANKTKGLSIDADSLKIDDSGIITFTTTLEKAGSEVETVRYKINDLNDALNANGSISKKYLGNNFVSDSELAELDELKNKIISLIEKRKELEGRADSGIKGSETEVKIQSLLQEQSTLQDQINSKLENEKLTRQEIEAIQSKINAADQAKVKNYTIPQNTMGGIERDYNNIFGKVDLDNIFADVKPQIQSVIQEAEKLKTTLASGDYNGKAEADELINRYKQLKATLKELNTEQNQINTKSGKYLDNIISNRSLSEYSQSEVKEMVKKLLSQKYKSNKFENIDYRPDKNQVNANIISGDKLIPVTANLQEYTNALGKTAIQIRTLTGAEKEYQSAGSKWVSGLKSKINSLTQYVTGLELVMRAWNEVKQGFNFVVSLDKEMTTVYQTMDITKQGLAELSQGAIDAAKDLGATSDQVVDTIGIYAAYGETVQSILSQARPTTMLANASGVDAKTAADQIQGVLQQYEELKGQEDRIVNTYEKIAANVQIDFDKGIASMAEGVQTAGSVAKEAGLEFENFAALVAKTAETTRLEGSQIGNATKTIIARTSRSKSADPDVTAEERSNAAAAYKSVGIDLYDNQGNYKNYTDTLDELASKWDTLTDAQRNYIAEQSAGVRNINIFTTMLDNWDEAKQLAQDALEDTGYAEEVQDKWMESLTGKINTLKASLEDFWHKLLDTDMISTGIELLTGLTNALQGLVGIFSSLGGIIPGVNSSFTTFFGLLGTGLASYKVFTDVSASKKNGGTILDGLKTSKDDVKNFFGKFKDNFSGIKDVFKQGFMTGFNREMAQSGKKATGFFRGLKSGAKGAISSLSGTTKAILGIGTAAVAIYAGVKAIDALTTSSKEAAEAASQASEKHKESQEAIASAKETVDSVGTEFETLSKGVNSIGENVSLTADEFKRYHEICNQLADIFPSLVTGYDEQGNAILNLKGNVEELLDAYDQLRLQKAEENYGNLNEYEEDFQNNNGNKSWLTEKIDYLTDLGKADPGGRVSREDFAETANKVAEMSYDDAISYIQELVKSTDKYNQDLASSITKVIGDLGSIEEDDWSALSQKLQTRAEEEVGTINKSAENMKSAMQSFLSILTLDKQQYPEYSKVDDEIITQASSLISKLTNDQLKQLEADGTSYEDYVKSLIDGLSKDDGKASLSLKNLLSIDENTDIEEVKKILEKDLKTLADALKFDDEAELKIKLGLEDEEELVKKAETVAKTVQNKVDTTGKKEIEKMVKETEAGNVYLGEDLINRRNKIGKDNENNIDVKTFSSEDGKKSVVVTPILPDGKVLTGDELSTYVNDVVLAGQEDTKNLVLATFDQDALKDGKVAVKEASKFAKNTNKVLKKNKDLKASQEDVNKFIKDNNIKTLDQVAALQQCVDETNSWADAMDKYSLENITMGDLDSIIENLEENLKVVETDINNINAAAEESHTSAGLSAESIENIVKAFEGLDGYNYDTLFESTAEGVHLNVKELERLNGEYEKVNKAKYADNISKARDEYSELCLAIEKSTDATERSQLIAKKNTLADQIDELQELESRYDGLTNSVTKFQQAMSGGEEGDNYDYIAQNAEEIKRLYDEGLTGTKKFRAYVQMMTNEDMSGKSNEEYIKMYEKMKPKFESYFTDDEATGAQNFLKALTGVNNEFGEAMASYDKANDRWTINVADTEKIAKELGISEAAVAEIFKKISDFGFDVNFSEETDNLKNLRAEAKAVNDQFGEFSDFKIDDEQFKEIAYTLGLNAEEAEKFKEQLKDFKFDLDIKDKDALADQIKDAEDLRLVLIEAFGEGSAQVKAFDKQLEYAKAKYGDLAKEEWIVDIHSSSGLKELEDKVNKLKDMDKIDIDIDFTNEDPLYIQEKLEKVKEAVKDMKNEDGTIDIKQQGAQEAISVLSGLLQKKQELEGHTVLDIDVSQLEGKSKQGVESLQQVVKAYQDLQLLEQSKEIGIPVDDSALDTARQKLNEVTQDFSGKNIEMAATLKLDNENIKFDAEGASSRISTALSNIKPEMMVEAGVNEEAIVGYTPPDKTMNIDADTSKVKEKMDAINAEANKNRTLTFSQSGLGTIESRLANIKSKTITVTTKEKKEAAAQGNAHAQGNARPTLLQRGLAFAKGTWGAAKNAASLVGELGQELVELLPDNLFNCWEFLKLIKLQRSSQGQA